MPGIMVSHLEQEPALDDGPTVEDNIMPAVKRIKDMMSDFEKVRPLEGHQIRHLLPPNQKTLHEVIGMVGLVVPGAMLLQTKICLRSLVPWGASAAIQWLAVVSGALQWLAEGPLCECCWPRE